MTGRYLDAPSRVRAASLGAWGGVGFLFRHDLGVYLAVTTLAAFVLVARAGERRSAARHTIVAVATAAALAAPYLFYLQQAGALSAAAQSGGALVDAASVTWRAFVGPGAHVDSWLRHDAENWLYYLFLLTPLVAGGLWLNGALVSTVANQLLVLAILCETLMLFLIRGNLDSRLPDVAAPSFMLVACVLARLQGAGQARSAWRWAAPATAIAVAVLTVASVEQLSDWQSGRHVVRTLIRLPTSVFQPIAVLRADPLEAWEREGTTDVRGLARWMRECSGSNDRFLVFGYHPEVFFYAKRLFAGGMLFLHAGYFSSPEEQRLSVTQLARQSVPFVIVEESTMPALDGTYAIIGQYVRRHYTLAGDDHIRRSALVPDLPELGHSGACLGRRPSMQVEP